jgi:hypothetical protein
MTESLCERCQNLQEVITTKGSRFLLCRLSKNDPAYPKYPPQPIVKCDGYRTKGGDRGGGGAVTKETR